MNIKVILRMVVVCVVCALAAMGARAATFSFSFDSGSQNQSGSPGDTLYYYGTLAVDSDTFNIASLSQSWDPGDGSGITFAPVVTLPKDISVSSPFHGLLFDLVIGGAAPQQKNSGLATFNGKWTSGLQGESGALSGQSFSVTVVPEPWEYGLIVVFGLLGLASYHRFSTRAV
jgi:hypothetical protein